MCARWRHLLVLTPAALSFLLSLSAQAATIHVPGDEPTIQAGIDAACVGDTVLVAAGTYHEHDVSMKPGVCLRSETGQADCVTIDAQHQGMVLRSINADEITSIRGFTITGGLSTSDSNPGGMRCSGSSLTVTNCAFFKNDGHNLGGGVLCTSGSPTFIDCTFSENTAGTNGGGLGWCAPASPTLVGCTFSGNSAGYRGGGVGCEDWLTDVHADSRPRTAVAAPGMSRNRSSPTLTYCIFSRNNADYGGGLYCYEVSPVLTGCLFSENNGAYHGGAVWCYHASPLLVDCTFSDNWARYTGGGIACLAGSPSLTDCTFSRNSVGNYGGAAYCNASDAAFTRCVFSENSAGACAGGINCYDSSPTFTTCTFAGNSAEYCGAILLQHESCPSFTDCTLSGNIAVYRTGALYCSGGSNPTLANTIIAFSVGQGPAVGCIYALPTFTCSDIYGNAGGDWVGDIANQYGINGNICEDPLFCRDQNPGKPYTLHEDSPCAPSSNPECGLVGAWGVGCASTAVEGISWGRIKAIFR